MAGRKGKKHGIAQLPLEGQPAVFRHGQVDALNLVLTETDGDGLGDTGCGAAGAVVNDLGFHVRIPPLATAAGTCAGWMTLLYVSA